MKVLDHIAIAAPQIMLPKEGTDLKKWSVIACDQYTSELEYWQQVEEEVGEAPSALRLILPEVYLGKESKDEISDRLTKIKSTAENYLENGVWKSLGDGFIVLDRSTPAHSSRKGLIVAIDLEQYSYEPGNKEKIRATEGTVISRIPPRVKIRASSPVEVPHVMLLIDDPDKTVIEKAWDICVERKNKPIYDTELMQDSGHVTGYFINSVTDIFSMVTNNLAELLDKSEDGMLFAVGDGNHSLASAKKYWDTIKDDLDIKDRGDHPARYALVEVVNIHDAGLDFEPIHRVVFGVDSETLIATAKEYFKDMGFGIAKDIPTDGTQYMVVVEEGLENKVITLSKPTHSLSVGSAQGFLDDIAKSNEGVEIDYIHGEDSVTKLATKGNCGIILPPVYKNAFFSTIAADGVFPRKTFSMGEAFEKRFYLEAKLIIK